MLVISTLGSLVISWWPRSLVRAWLSDKPPVTTLVSISWLVAVPGLTWLHYRPSITSLTPPTHPSCCSATAAAASQLLAQLPSWSCEPRCCLTTKKPLAGPEWWWVQAETWSHHTGLAIVTVVTIGALCSVLAMLGGPQLSPAQVCWMQWAVIPWQIPSAPRCWGRQRGHWTPDPGLQLDFLIQKIFKPNKKYLNQINISQKISSAGCCYKQLACSKCNKILLIPVKANKIIESFFPKVLPKLFV